MMNAQTITTPSGERLVLIPEAEFNALVEAAEDAVDRSALASFRRSLEAGEEELVPACVVDRILNGESRIKVWREHRGLSGAALSRQTGMSQSFLSQIETGQREGTVETLRKVAAALNVTLDDLAG
jgi:ribosome-binding protein aMBF1 (putative translation factor)